jgi:hypothetical protein
MTPKETTHTGPESQRSLDETINVHSRITKATAARTFLLCFCVPPFTFWMRRLTFIELSMYATLSDTTLTSVITTWWSWESTKLSFDLTVWKYLSYSTEFQRIHKFAQIVFVEPWTINGLIWLRTRTIGSHLLTWSWIPLNIQNFLASGVTLSFSRRTPLHVLVKLITCFPWENCH